MRADWRRVLLLTAGGVAGLVGLGLALAPGTVDRLYNGVDTRSPRVADRSRALHRTLRVADLHADTLVWGREMLRRSDRGQVDVPRLMQGNVAMQVFSAVTVAGSDWDRMTPLAMAQLWPRRAWRDPVERALVQSRRMEKEAAGSEGRLRLVRSAEDLRDVLADRGTAREPVGAVLALEGLHGLEGSLDRLDRLYRAGFRMAGLVHFSDTEVAGSLHGRGDRGLTPFGQRVVRRMEEMGMIVDLAHASPRTVDDVLAVATRPVVVSHTGVRATCDSPRNLDDDRLRRLAAAGGLIGIGYWRGATCGDDLRAAARAMRHAAGIAGVEHLALGSDFDGAVRQPIDASGLAAVTDALLAEGFTDEEIHAIAGGNALRFLEAGLARRPRPR